MEQGRLDVPIADGLSRKANTQLLGYTYQFLLVAALVAIVGYAAFNLITNLHSRAITVGFSYLSQEAGFDIAERLIAYEPSDSYGRAFVVGLLNTLLVSFLGVIAATLGGLVIGIGRLSSNWVVRKFATWYVECVRNVPLILQLLLWYGMLTELLPPVASALGWKSIFLSQRGMTMPWPEEPAGLYGLLYGILAAAILLLCMHGWKKRQNRLGAECGNWLTKHSLGLHRHSDFDSRFGSIRQRSGLCTVLSGAGKFRF